MVSAMGVVTCGQFREWRMTDHLASDFCFVQNGTALHSINKESAVSRLLGDMTLYNAVRVRSSPQQQ
jgi:hypothetical protein